MWNELPSDLSRRILDVYLQNCYKQKSVQILAEHVVNEILAKNDKTNIKILFTLHAKKNNDNSYLQVGCLLQYGRIYVEEKHGHPSSICLFEHKNTEYVFDPLNEEIPEKVYKLLYELIIKLYDNASHFKYQKAICSMSITDNNSITLLNLPSCPDLYTKNP